MKNINKIILVLLLTALTVKCTLEIYSPQNFKTRFTNNSIKYSVANFGHIPFGKTLIGKMAISQPLTGCNKNQITFPEHQNPFLLMQRGDCTFVKKVTNAQNLGATLAIITDNVNEFGNYLIMKDDGNGYKVNIPSIMIDIVDGQKLKAIRNETNQPIVLKIVFDTHKSSKVNLTLWLQTENRQSYKLLRNFAENFTKLKDNVNLDIVHKTMNCYYCKEADCYKDNLYRFCALPDDPQSRVSGQNIIDQQIRQKIVYQQYPTQWWKYMDTYDKQCSNLLQAKICSAKIFKQLNIDQKKIQSLIVEKRISILKDNSIKLDNGGVTTYPSASINTVKVPGNLKAEYLTEQICSTLENPPIMCGDDKESAPVILPVSKSSFILTILLVIFIITIVFIISVIDLQNIQFCIYRRYIRRELSNEMSSQVNNMVSKYIEFHSERNNKP